MILRALTDYYERMLEDPDCDVAPPGFEKKAIPFLIVLDRNGKMVGLRDTREGEGKKRPAREYLVPKGEKRSSGIKPNLLWDTPQYLFGTAKGEKEKDIKRAKEACAAFKDRIETTFTLPFQDEGVDAVKSYLSQGEFNSLFQHDLWKEIEETAPNMSFMLASDSCLIAQRPQVVSLLRNQSTPGGDLQTCSVTGEPDVAEKLHTSIKRVWGAQPSGASIVSFNLNAFCSFHKQQSLNAPVGSRAMFAYTTALNSLLAEGSKQRMQIGDTSTVFWANEQHPFEDDFAGFLGEPPKGEKPDYGKLRSLLSAVRTGVLPKEDDLPFFVLGLAPNAARISIRFWYEGNIRDMKEKIAKHFEDIEIVRAPHDREFLSLFQLLVSTATEGKADNIPPNLGGEMARAVMSGTAYPRTILAGALRRCKAEQKVTHARVAVMKGFLVRNARLNRSTQTEVNMALDKTNENIGYVLGRLFAVLERIQEQALTGLNKTIRDTYFSAATSNPLVIFKRLQDLSIHHLAKIRNAGKKTVWLEKQMQEVIDKISAEGIPAALSLEDQSRFAIGYYHQRNEFFLSKDDKSSKETDETP